MISTCCWFYTRQVDHGFVFVSSRRRHTRLQGDWSSDVCSSDLRRSVFFFQAEDGIRDLTVTGVQTCALPICNEAHGLLARERRGGAGAEHRQASAQVLELAAPVHSGRVPEHMFALLGPSAGVIDRKSVG